MVGTIEKAIFHQLFTYASNGSLRRGAKILFKEVPEHSALIKSFCFKNSDAAAYLRNINYVANAFKANRAAAGIKESFTVLV